MSGAMLTHPSSQVKPLPTSSTTSSQNQRKGTFELSLLLDETKCKYETWGSRNSEWILQSGGVSLSLKRSMNNPDHILPVTSLSQVTGSVLGSWLLPVPFPKSRSVSLSVTCRHPGVY